MQTVQKCPVNLVLSILSAKWTTEILRELCIGPTRTRRFLAHIPGLTMKCLRQRLVALEALGLVHRQEFDERPLRVEYTITEKGRKLFGLVSEIKVLADEWHGKSCTCPMELPAGSEEEYVCPPRRELRYRSV
jgi:DNA-binding HxlR family transcriptional regulator